MKNQLLKELDRYVVACITATAMIMCTQACVTTPKAKPLSDTVSRIPDDNLADSLQKASMDADVKASKDKFKAERAAKAKGL